MKQKHLHIIAVLVALLLPCGTWADNLKVGDDFQVGGMTYRVTDTNKLEVTLTQGDKSVEGKVNIEKRVAGPDGKYYSVTAIGKGAFNNCKGLTGVIIPSSVKKIDDEAFFNCYNLESVNLSIKVDSIGYLAFGNCSKITQLTLPSSLKYIGERGLAQMSRLETIVIPKSVISIGKQVLFADYALTSIKVESGNAVYDSRNNCNAIICKETKELIMGCRMSTIPENIVSIADAAFCYMSPINTSLTFPSTLTNIGEWAFATIGGGSGLTSLFIPKSVKTIGKSAFDNQSTIEKIEVEEGNTAFDTRDGCNALICTSTNELIRACHNSFIPNTVTAIGDGAFSSLGYYDESPDFSSIIIPNSVTKIGSTAFRYCGQLTSITLPSNLKTIGEEAFYGCDYLKYITIPASVEEIGKAAFNDCYSLETIISLSENPTEIGIYVSSSGKQYIYPIISDYEKVSLFVPAGCKSKYEATGGWDKFKNITEGNNLFTEKTSEGVDITYEITSQSPKECRVLVAEGKIEGAVTVPSFANGYKVTEIKERAFGINKGLTTIDTGNTIETIGQSAFYYCIGLTSATIGNSVKTIGKSAFSSCTGLTSVTIGKSVTSIGTSAFWGCKNLQKVTSYIKEPFAVDARSFQYYDSEKKEYVFIPATLYVPAGTKAKYEATDGWKEFKNIMEMEPEKPYEVKDDGTAVVKNLEPDENGQLVISEKVEIDGKEYPVTEIAPEAFKDNQDLVEVTIPGTVTTIGAGAFAGCGNLRAIYLMSTTPIALSQAAVRGVIRRADGTAVSQFDGVDYETCVLYVPYGCGEAYRNAEGWKLFKHIVEMEDTGINGATLNDKGQMINDKWYDLKGRRISQPKKGVNILRDGNGKTKVVVIK